MPSTATVSPKSLHLYTAHVSILYTDAPPAQIRLYLITVNGPRCKKEVFTHTGQPTIADVLKFVHDNFELTKSSDYALTWKGRDVIGHFEVSRQSLKLTLTGSVYVGVKANGDKSY